MTTGIVILPDGTHEERSLGALPDYQLAVGGYIEPIYLRNGHLLLVNEEGLYRFPAEATNPLATSLGAYLGAPRLLEQPLRGPAILLSHRDGDFTDVDPDARHLLELLAEQRADTVR